MCSQNRNRRQTTPTGTCRWLDGAAEAREAILDGRPALLEIVVRRADGKEVAGYYFLSAVEGGWLLSKEEKGQLVEHYWISRDLWSCGCKSHEFTDRECKHLRSLAAALPKIGF